MMEGPPELEQIWRFLEHILLGSRHAGDPEDTGGKSLSLFILPTASGSF